MTGVDMADMRRRANRMRRMMEKRHGKPKTMDVPVLENLDFELPIAMPGDKLHLRPPRIGVGELFPPLLEGVTWYTPDGRPIEGDTRQQAMSYHYYRADRSSHLQSRTFYRSGVKIWVSTVYVGIDMGMHLHSEHPPIIWETMIFAGDFGGLNTWRYATPAAAYHGHKQVVAAVAAAQRMHRAAVPYIPPRRGSVVVPRPIRPVVQARLA